MHQVFQPNPSNKIDEDREIANLLKNPLQTSLPIEPTNHNETAKIIQMLDANKTPGYDLIIPLVLKKLPHRATVLITAIFNAILRSGCYPGQWKAAQIILIPKPGKDPIEVKSYRPISLLPVLSKVFEKLILLRMKPHLTDSIPNHQFGFRVKHSTIEQVHRVTNTISNTSENKQYCSAAFLDISQAFDKVWHEGLLYKIKKILPQPFYLLLRS